MYVSIFIYPHACVCLSIYLFSYLRCLSVLLSLYLSIDLSVCLLTHLLYLFIYPASYKLITYSPNHLITPGYTASCASTVVVVIWFAT